MLWNGSKPAGLPAFPQSSYLYCFMAILTEIPVLMPHLELSWQGRAWHGREETRRRVVGPGRLAPGTHPGTHPHLHTPLSSSPGHRARSRAELSAPGWGPAQRSPGMPVLGGTRSGVPKYTLSPQDSALFAETFASLQGSRIQPPSSPHQSRQDPWGLRHQPAPAGSSPAPRQELGVLHGRDRLPAPHPSQGCN